MVRRERCRRTAVEQPGDVGALRHVGAACARGEIRRVRGRQPERELDDGSDRGDLFASGIGGLGVELQCDGAADEGA
jgi:hypothetical protein